MTPGSRKTASRLLAKDCPATAIVAVTAHGGRERAARYTRAAEQERLRAAMEGLVGCRPAAQIAEPFAVRAGHPINLNEIRPLRWLWRSLRESNPSFKIENLAS